MYSNMTYEEKVAKLIAYHPDRVKDIFADYHDQDPMCAEKTINRALMGHHLDEDLMKEALMTIVRYDGMRPPFWSYEETVAYVDMHHPTANGEKFNDYDIHFLAQYYAADFKSLGTDHGVFIGMALDRLRDVDDPKAAHHAYHVAKKRLHKK